jgi:hypothetical protein
MPNPCNKTRSIKDPYERWVSEDGWEWLVLKKYQTPENEAKNRYARWFCAVKSPFTHGSYEFGDTYCADVKREGKQVDME